MKRLPFLILATLLSLSVILGSVEGAVYTDTDGRYTMEFPDNWVEGQQPGIDVIYMDPVQDSFQENINIISAKDSSVKNTKQYVLDLMEVSIDGLKVQYPGTTIVSEPTAREINGHWSASYVMDLAIIGITIREKQTLVVSEGYSMAFVITCSALPSDFDDYAVDFNDSIETFTITNEPAINSETARFLMVVLVGGAAGAGGALVVVLLLRRKGKADIYPQAPLPGSYHVPLYQEGAPILPPQGQYMGPPPVREPPVHRSTPPETPPKQIQEDARNG